MRLSYGPFKESHDLAKQGSVVDLKVDDFVEQNIIVQQPLHMLCCVCTVHSYFHPIHVPRFCACNADTFYVFALNGVLCIG